MPDSSSRKNRHIRTDDGTILEVKEGIVLSRDDSEEPYDTRSSGTADGNPRFKTYTYQSSGAYRGHYQYNDQSFDLGSSTDPINRPRSKWPLSLALGFLIPLFLVAGFFIFAVVAAIVLFFFLITFLMKSFRGR